MGLHAIRLYAELFATCRQLRAENERLREGIRAVIAGDEPRTTCVRCGESCACVHAFLGKLLEGGR